MENYRNVAFNKLYIGSVPITTTFWVWYILSGMFVRNFVTISRSKNLPKNSLANAYIRGLMKSTPGGPRPGRPCCPTPKIRGQRIGGCFRAGPGWAHAGLSATSSAAGKPARGCWGWCTTESRTPAPKSWGSSRRHAEPRESRTWERCFGFWNIFAEMFGEHIGVFCWNYC
jgi:hypothetical protein